MTLPESVSVPNGEFYLGRIYDQETKSTLQENVLYDSSDLTTHALCVGMTGSGKTGLCITLLEEAILQNVPAICIDPKGDLGNLLLTFPDANEADFAKYLDPKESQSQTSGAESVAAAKARSFKEGVANWGMQLDRVRALKEKSDITIFTPGSTIGVPLTVLKSFSAPSEEERGDVETFREKIATSASGLLTLLGIESDPLSSREHILISKILEHAWNDGQDILLEDLVRQIQSPPIEKVGVIDVESFMPTADRVKLAFSLNNLLASPSFAGWLTGEPLDIDRMLYNSGKPRLSIINIAHLDDSERMFFVTILLGELISWMRSQPGTGELRAIFYMDEIYGYFPPSAKPPSKPPMLTLLKQARAFGLGIVLATQNPVDLDYKGLSNIGTWFLGRLQTQRDKDRVLDGLEGASAQAATAFNRTAMEKLLSSLSQRVFVLNNVHNDHPLLFKTRTALSFLKGPLTRSEIQMLMKDQKDAIHRDVEPKTSSATASHATTRAKSSAQSQEVTSRPVAPAGIDEKFLSESIRPKTDSLFYYRPSIVAKVSVHFVQSGSGIDSWKELTVISQSKESVSGEFWKGSKIVDGDLQLESSANSGWKFQPLPSLYCNAKNYILWEKDLKDHLFRTSTLNVYFSPLLKKNSAAGDDETSARISFTAELKQLCEQAIAKQRSKNSDKLQVLETKIATAKAKVGRESSKRSTQWISTVADVLITFVSAKMGRKKFTKTNMTRAVSAAKKFGNAASSTSEPIESSYTLQQLYDQKARLEQEFEEAIQQIRTQHSPESLELKAIEVTLRKADTKVAWTAIGWIPCEETAEGTENLLVKLD